jgi:hypothetical protein
MSVKDTPKPHARFCPPCCTRCAFDAKGQPVDLDYTKVTVAAPVVIVSRTEYDCKLPGGSEIVLLGDVLGALRPDGFHPITDAGREFHRAQHGSPLAAHC